jgi:hypothetical protein
MPKNLTALLRLNPQVSSIRQALIFAHFKISGWISPPVALLNQGQKDGFQGVLALQDGRTTEAISLFQRSVEYFVRMGGVAWVAADGLSLAFEQSGNLPEAAKALERVSADRFRYEAGPEWLRNQAHLADLYHKLGRDQDARKTEDELRKLLAFADAGHPILRQLQKR